MQAVNVVHLVLEGADLKVIAFVKATPLLVERQQLCLSAQDCLCGQIYLDNRIGAYGCFVFGAVESDIATLVGLEIERCTSTRSPNLNHTFLCQHPPC